MDFGGLEQVKEECRDARGVSLLETLAQDLRYGWRTLLKSPGFAAAALFTLALGIGANTAIFSVVYGVLLQPLPFRDAARLVLLHETTPKVGDVSVSYPNFQDWRAQSHTFSEMAAVSNVGFNMTGASQPENIGGLAVSPNFLSMAGVRPVIGRGFTPDEEKAGTAPVLLLSYALWQSHFGGDRRVIGQTIRLDSRTVTIVGVLPRDFRWVETCDVMEPMGVWATNNGTVAERGDRGDLRWWDGWRRACGWSRPARKWMALRHAWRARIHKPTTSAASNCNRFARPSRATRARRCWCCWEPRSLCFWWPAPMWRICS
jgi:hypothetical protein